MSDRISIGKLGERLAVEYLSRVGYEILAKNYRSSYGEIDIIALCKDGTTVFVEVKSRSGSVYGLPSEAVNARKRSKIEGAALLYMQDKGVSGRVRFDIISVMLSPSGKPELDHLIDAFETRG